MIYNGFDPGTLAWLAGEDRLPATSGEVLPLGRLEAAILASVSAVIGLVAVILLSGGAS